jgi:hypothetical protein
MMAVGTLLLGSLTLVTAIARRIAGPYGRRGLGPETVLGVHMAAGGADAKRAVEDLREEVEQLRAEVADLRSRAGELDEVQNRLDFAERMLAQVREKNALPGPR